MIVTEMESIVLKTEKPVSIRVGGTKFVCAPKWCDNEVTTTWYYTCSSKVKNFWDARNFFERILKIVCPHNNTELNITGGNHFVAGEVLNDVEEELFCLDCGKTLEDK